MGHGLPSAGRPDDVRHVRQLSRARLRERRLRPRRSSRGWCPVLLPPHLDEATRAALWTRLDALVLSGGGDVDPARFGEPPHAKVCEVSPERDELELGFTRRALDDGVPLLAICRGIQVLT